MTVFFKGSVEAVVSLLLIVKVLLQMTWVGSQSATPVIKDF